MSIVYKKIRVLSVVIFSFFLAFAPFQQPLYAQDLGDGIGICDFIGPICSAIGITDESGQNASNIAQNFVTSRLSLVVSFIFIGIILLSVVIIIQNGVKYIRSQGDEGEITTAQKAIQTVFAGIAFLFVGIIGLVLVLAFFNGTGLLDQQGTNSDGCGFNTEGIFECGDGNVNGSVTGRTGGDRE